MVSTQTHSKNKIYSKIVGLFLFLTIIAIGVILHFALAKATIKIYSHLETKTDTVLVEIQPEDIAEISPEAIFGKIIAVEFEVSGTMPTTEQKVDGKKAAGYVTIINNYSQNQPLVKTTRLLTADNKLYRITEGVTVPAGGQVEVWVEADQEGAEFAIGPSKFTIPGLWEGLQDKIYAESTTNMELQNLPKYIVTEEDLNKVKEQIKEGAIEKSLITINESLSDNLKIDKNKLSLNFETLESSTIGEETKEVMVKQKITGYGLIFSEEDLKTMAEEKFTKGLESNQSLVEFLPTSGSYTILEINPQTNKAVLEVNLEATINSNQGNIEIEKDKLIGLNKEEAEEYLRQELKIDSAEVKLSPFWVKSVPKLKDHIIIE